MRTHELRRRLDELYLHYDHRFVDPDPLQLVRAQETDADREVVGLIASALAYGNVLQIKRSITAVLGLGAAVGDEVTITADGPDAEQALDAVLAIVTKGSDA